MHQEQSVDIMGAVKSGLVGLGLYISTLDFEMLMIWSIVAAIDVIVGVIAAIKSGTYRSNLNASGLTNKILEFFLLIAVVFAQRAAQKLGYNLPAAAAVFGAFIVKDIGSIMETLIERGVPLPKKIKDWFAIAHKEANDPKEEEK